MNPAEREAQETCLELIRTLENVHRCYHVAWTINEHIESVNEEHKRFFLLAFEALIERSAMSICKAFDRQKNSASVPNVLIILQKQAVWPSVWMRIVGWPTNTAIDKFEFAQNEAKRIVAEIEGEADNVRPFLKDFKNFRNREVAHVQPQMSKKYPLHSDLETCAACCASIADNFRLLATGAVTSTEARSKLLTRSTTKLLESATNLY